jgi:sec-independent protein translocase protein TatC
MARDYETEPSDEAEGGPIKSFLEHLEDFRWVLIKCVVTLSLAMLVCLFGAKYVIAVLKRPLAHAPIHSSISNPVVDVNFGTNHLGNFPLAPETEKSLGLGTNPYVAVQIQPLTIGTNRVLGWYVTSNTVPDAQGLNIELINLSPAGAFFVAFQVAIYAGMVLASPFILYFVASFVFPALKMHERKHVYRALFFGGGLFITGVSFCYFVLMPVALAAAQFYATRLGFGASQWRAEDYISFVCKFMLGMGLGFEMPVVVLTLVKIGVLSYSTLAGARRYMIVINLFLGAVLTTPEVITQILMFVPLQLLYEITVWIAWYWDRQEKKRENVESLKS